MSPRYVRPDVPDTKEGRERQARRRERRQRRREVAEERARGDEAEPPAEEGPPLCHRRGCDAVAEFLVTEHYPEETGHGLVEATATLCLAHAREESPANLAPEDPDYRFVVEPLPDDETGAETTD